MNRVPPYIPGLPPHIQQEFLDRWGNPPPRPEVRPPVPVADPPVVNRKFVPADNQGKDPVAGTWATSDGTWCFTKDAKGYSLIERSALLGQTGQGRATLNGQMLLVDFTSAMLGRMSITLTLNGDVMQGTVSVWGMPVSYFLQRA
jgi:hypothetical protein